MSCCENSQSVVLFADGDRNDGTEEVIFDTKQSEKIYYFRDYSLVIPPTTVVATIQSGGGVSNLGNSVDKDTQTSTLVQAGGGGTTVIRFDWGSQASRDVIAILFGNSIASSRSLTVNARFAGTDLIFSSFQQIFQVADGAIQAKTRFRMPFGVQTLRYVELQIVSVGTTTTNIFEVFNADEGLGTSDVNIQVKNSITSNFLTVDTLSTIDSVASIEKLDEKNTFQPNASFTRIQLVNDGKWNGSVGALLVNPKFT